MNAPTHAESLITAEALKDLVRRYAEQNPNLAGWACASISFRVGKVGESETETLLVMPGAVTPTAVSSATHVR